MPKRIDLEAQRRLITEAAIAVINEAGLEGARLRDVARAAEVTTGAVLHYFDDKDAVLVAALEEIVSRTLARMETPSDRYAPGDVAGFLRRVGRYLPKDAAGRAEWRVWLAFWGRAIADERLREIHGRHYRKFVERLMERLRSLATAEPPPARRQLRRTADAVIAAIDGIGTRATLEPARWPARRQQEALEAGLRPLLTEFVHGIPDAARSTARASRRRGE